MSKEDKILQPFTARFDGCKHKNRHKLMDIKRDNVYNDIINRIGCTMFKWDGLPDEFLKSCDGVLMELSINCGCAVVYKIPENISTTQGGEWACTPVEFTGVLKNNGTSDHFITSGSDYCVTDKELKDYVIIKNDPLLSCEYDITEWFASMLSDTDIAERALIRWSRMTPIARANTGVEAGKLQETLKRVYEGEPYLVISDNSKMINGGSPMSRDDSVLRLTDESAIERMHFLSEFHYELVRRICNLYNMPFHTTAKSAQNLESEVHNTDVFSQALTPERLKERQKACDELNKLFGWNVSVNKGETIQKEDDIINSNVAEEIQEGLNSGDDTTSNDADSNTNDNNDDEKTDKKDD